MPSLYQERIVRATIYERDIEDRRCVLGGTAGVALENDRCVVHHIHAVRGSWPRVPEHLCLFATWIWSARFDAFLCARITDTGGLVPWIRKECLTPRS